MRESREDMLLGSMRRVELGDRCPLCHATPLVVEGSNPRPSADDKAFEADATTACCKRLAGTLREELSTIFGARDVYEILLNGRARVYG